MKPDFVLQVQGPDGRPVPCVKVLLERLDVERGKVLAQVVPVFGADHYALALGIT